jgi:hypothetical protein
MSSIEEELRQLEKKMDGMREIYYRMAGKTTDFHRRFRKLGRPRYFRDDPELYQMDYELSRVIGEMMVFCMKNNIDMPQPPAVLE